MPEDTGEIRKGPKDEYPKPVIERTPIEQLIPGIKLYADNFSVRLNRREPTTLHTPMSNLLLRWQNGFIAQNKEGEESPFLKLFKEFKDQIVVDLGAGRNRNGYIIAALNDAKGYVGVEPGNSNFNNLAYALLFRDHEGDSLVDELNRYNKPFIPLSLANTDALSVLRGIPPASVSVFTSGIDEFILGDEPEYVRAVGSEIERVLHPNGAFINYDSVFHLKSSEFEQIRLSRAEAGKQWIAMSPPPTKYIRKRAA